MDMTDSSVPPPFQDPSQKKTRFPIKRIIAMSIGTIIGVPLMLVSFVHFQSAVFTKASDVAPRDVVISEITATSATVEYYTDQESQAVILYGTEANELKFLAPDQTKTNEHKVTISLLIPKTTYYYAIKIGEDIYQDGNVPYTFTTKATEAEQSPTPTLTNTSPTLSTSDCPMTNDCDVIRGLMGKVCSSSNYIQCLKRRDSAQ
jgi:hypothetical protein